MGCSATDSGTREFTVLAQSWQRDVCAAVAVRYGDMLEVNVAAPDGLGLTAFFDADLFRFGAFDLTACCQALVAKHPQCFDFGALAAALAVFKDFKVTGAGHTVFVNRFFPFWRGAPEHQEFANMLNRRGVKFVRERLKHGFSRDAVVRKDTNFDQSVGVQGGVSFFFNRGSETVTAHHHDRIKMVSFGTVYFALSRGQLNLGHPGIIGHEGKNES